jgi:ATP synthase F1 complex assembly factor 1
MASKRLVGISRPYALSSADDAVRRALHGSVSQRAFEGGSLGLSLPSAKSLWDILKREHIQGHSAQHVRDIWQEYHLDPAKHRVSTVLSKQKYDVFCETAGMTPMFVLPVFRGPNSFETFALQCQPPLVLFTSLEEYKRHGSSATPHFVLSHYTELVDSHGMVLVRGDIIQPHALDAIQASSLMHNAHEYFTDFGAKREFVQAFNKRPERFDFKKLLDSMGHATDGVE